jgi:hypothetical protein
MLSESNSLYFGSDLCEARSHIDANTSSDSNRELKSYKCALIQTPRESPLVVLPHTPQRSCLQFIVVVTTEVVALRQLSRGVKTIKFSTDTAR